MSENTPPPPESWHGLAPEAVLAHWGVTVSGWSAEEAARRSAAEGANELPEPDAIHAWTLVVAQFKSLLVWILIVAGLASGLMGAWMDATAILAIVLLNAAIGFHQEFRAEKSIAALRKMAAPKAVVRRDGQPVVIAARDLVTGDLLVLESGDMVAADARLVEAASLACVEASLTGESEAVGKTVAALEGGDVALGDRTNMVFMGTGVATGVGLAVVTATGPRTELGRIAELLQDAGREKSMPLRAKLDAAGRMLAWASLGLVGVLFLLGLWRDTPFLELFLTSVSLAVAAVPEGLPAVVTVALSAGVMRMARRQALIRRLEAVETLGSTTVICTDKTGTLTVGEMTVRTLWAGGCTYAVGGTGYGPDGEVLPESGQTPNPALADLAAALVGGNRALLKLENGAWSVVGDPTEGALLVAGQKGGANRDGMEAERPKFHEIPFDSDRKRNTVIRSVPGGALCAYVNGAPGPLLERCSQWRVPEGTRPLTDQDRADILALTSSLALRSLRVLASASRDLEAAAVEILTADFVEHDLVFLGLSGMYDPPRPEARESVALCRTAGIQVVMITGDHPETAAAIAREIGIAEEGQAALTGREIDPMSDADLRARLLTTFVFARVTAAHKLRIIRAWQAESAVVAMTGDGVNDAPALRGADIGIAMGKSGTEVTRQAADMVITDDQFSTIVAAVQEGRGIYDNIRKTLLYLLSGNTGEILLMAVCVVAGTPMPLLPIHLLWINLVTDGLPALCLATDPVEADLMQRRPRPAGGRLIDRAFVQSMVTTGLLTAAVSLAVFFHGLAQAGLEEARTRAFTTLVFAELLRAFGARSATVPLWRIPLRTNLRLLGVVLFSMALQVLSHHQDSFGTFLKSTPLPYSTALCLLAVGAIPLLALEAVKAWRNRASRRDTPPVG